jgi:hypothetical protein
MSDTFYWHDYETWGADPRRDRPCQFAGSAPTPISMRSAIRSSSSVVRRTICSRIRMPVSSRVSRLSVSHAKG